MTKSEVFHQAFGYELNSIKPVHLANGFFLALTGRHYRLEWLNKLAVISHKKGLKGDYETPKLRDIFTNEKMIMGAGIGDGALNHLRSQANSIVANDDAVYAAFDDYSAFGNDYTLSSPQFLCDIKRKDGYSGYFIYSVFEASNSGRLILALAKDEFEREGDSLAKLFRPVLDSGDVHVEWENKYEEKLGSLANGRVAEIASKMERTTAAILRLLETSRNVESRYSFLRQLVTALGVWLTLYLIREASTAVGINEPPILFCDFTGNASRKCRSKSVNCFSRHREMIYRSFHAWLESGRVSSLDPFLKGGRVDLKDIERHFQDLSVRVGLAQPRAAVARAKHYELQADTVRALVMSLINPDNMAVTFQELAIGLREVWGVVFGGCDDDVARLAAQGIIGLDEDDDLSLNRRYFITQLKALGLAFEPSDGLVLCEVNREGDR